MRKTKPFVALKGRVRVAVIDHLGNELKSYPWQRNLLLDQGMDNLAEVLICDLFSVAVKGIGEAATTETVGGANNFTAGSGTVTRTAGSRDFTSDDVGKWLGRASDPNMGGKILSITSATEVEIEDPEDSVAFTNEDIILFSVEQVGLEEEFEVDGPSQTFTKPLGDGTVTASSSFFSSGEVGRAIYFPGSDISFLITAFTDSTHVEVDISSGDADITAETAFITDIRNDDLGPLSRSVDYGQVSGDNSTTTAGNVRTFKRSFVFAAEPEILEDIADTNTYSQAATTVTRTAGTRDFTADDVGKTIYFDNAQTEKVITAFTSATQVTVADSATIGAQTAKLYGFNTYHEIGFSDKDAPGDNLNIRVKLASGVDVSGPTPSLPSRQLKVTYELTLTVEPDTSQSGNLGPLITGGSAMNANQSGNYAIESFSTSRVDSDGSTNNDFAILDPATPGYLGLSTNLDAIDPLSDKVRSENTAFVEMEAETYSSGAASGQFSRNYTGTFGLNDAIGTAWRSLFLGDQDTNIAVFTFRFANNQAKTGERTFSMTISKTWARDLS